MWEEAGPGRWRRDDGYLLRVGDRLIELHMHDGPGGDTCTVHVYVEGVQPEAQRLMDLGLILPQQSTGSPLDGHHATATRDGLPSPTDDDAAWRLLQAIALED